MVRQPQPWYIPVLHSHSCQAILHGRQGAHSQIGNSVLSPLTERDHIEGVRTTDTAQGYGQGTHWSLPSLSQST